MGMCLCINAQCLSLLWFQLSVKAHGLLVIQFCDKIWRPLQTYRWLQGRLRSAVQWKRTSLAEGRKKRLEMSASDLFDQHWRHSFSQCTGTRSAVEALCVMRYTNRQSSSSSRKGIPRFQSHCNHWSSPRHIWIATSKFLMVQKPLSPMYKAIKSP